MFFKEGTSLDRRGHGLRQAKEYELFSKTVTKE